VRILDLFAGIGGFSLAAHWMGWSTAAFVEKESVLPEGFKEEFRRGTLRYMTTFSHLTGDLFGEELTSSPADSPASRSQQPESERVEPMSDISFRKCFELFERSHHVGSSLKTFAGCLVSNLEQYSPRLSHHWKGEGYEGRYILCSC
jgi:hypothetical protein